MYSEYQCVCVILHMFVITQDGISALMLAAWEGKTENVVELVKAGANVDMQDEVCTAMSIHLWYIMYTTYRNTHHYSRLTYHTL